jgi:hypothetical protein
MFCSTSLIKTPLFPLRLVSRCCSKAPHIFRWPASSLKAGIVPCHLRMTLRASSSSIRCKHTTMRERMLWRESVREGECCVCVSCVCVWVCVCESVCVCVCVWYCCQETMLSGNYRAFLGGDRRNKCLAGEPWVLSKILFQGRQTKTLQAQTQRPSSFPFQCYVIWLLVPILCYGFPA